MSSETAIEVDIFVLRKTFIHKCGCFLIKKSTERRYCSRQTSSNLKDFFSACKPNIFDIYQFFEILAAESS